MLPSSRRHLVLGGLAAAFLLIWTARLLPLDYRGSWASATDALRDNAAASPAQRPPASAASSNGLSLPHVDDYFEQAFSPDPPAHYEYAALREACGRVEWRDDVYVKCAGMAAGLTSIISEVKTCLKMAVDTGSNLVLPAMPLRDSKKLLEFNFLNGDAYMTYDRWFDADHLADVMARACPKMKIVHPDELNVTVPVKYTWEILCNQAPGFHDFSPFFWVGNPYSTFFATELEKLQVAAFLDPARDDTKHGISVITVDSRFVLFRILDDPTQRELRLWNDLSYIIRFLKEPRDITNRLLGKMQRPYYGVHFRVENDTIWSSFDHQLSVDLDGLDKAWQRFGSPSHQKPLVYVACGDESQAERFVVAGAERGWEVTHKWKLLEGDAETTKMVNDLAFDFQGAVDLGIMVRGQFFFGITGSAFSSTLSNLRDPTGRYRGSSLLLPDDGGARSHLFFDGDAGGYPCCL